MKRMLRLFAAMSCLAVGTPLLVSAQQEWSLPSDNKEQTWVTPDLYGVPYPDDSEVESFTGKVFSKVMRIPNRFKIGGSNSNYTFSLGIPDASAGYLTVGFSFISDMVGTFTAKNDITIGGKKILKSGEYGYWVRDNSFGCPGPSFRLCSDSTDKLGLTFVFCKARNSDDAIILWAIYSKDSRYQ